MPPVPFRAPPGIKLVRVNHKSGLPAGAGDKTAIMEAFKPGQEPAGSVVAEDGADGRRDGRRRLRCASPCAAAATLGPAPAPTTVL